MDMLILSELESERRGLLERFSLIICCSILLAAFLVLYLIKSPKQFETLVIPIGDITTSRHFKFQASTSVNKVGMQVLIYMHPYSSDTLKSIAQSCDGNIWIVQLQTQTLPSTLLKMQKKLNRGFKVKVKILGGTLLEDVIKTVGHQKDHYLLPADD